MTFRYDGADRPVFENVSFAMPDAKVVWIRSPGQRGKSTLLRILAGLLTPQSGRYLINGEAVNEMSFEEFLPFRLAMGYGFDLGGLLNNKTLGENLILPLLYHDMLPVEEAADRVEEVVRHFGLAAAANQRPFSVSGSQRKLTCVVRSFMHWPQVVLLDDPGTGLKQDNLNDLVYFVEESFASRNLRQLYFTGESNLFESRLKVEELMVSADWFTTRAVA